MNDVDVSLPDDRMEAMAEKLEAYAESLDPAEREVVRRIIDAIIDPWTRLRRREGGRLFDREEIACLGRMEREP